MSLRLVPGNQLPSGGWEIYLEIEWPRDNRRADHSLKWPSDRRRLRNPRAPDWLTYNYHSFLQPILLRIVGPYVR